MLTPEEKRGWLEAITELKAQYYIGSRDAFYCLKTKRWYEQINQLINERSPTLRREYNLTIKKTNWLISLVKAIMESVIQLAAFRSSTPENFALNSRHQISLPIKDQHFYADPNRLEWSIDFVQLLTNFLEVSPPDIGHQLVASLKQWVTQLWYCGTLQPSFLEDGKHVSYNTFMANKKYRYRGTASLEMISILETIYADGDDFDNPFSDEEWVTLRRADRRNDVATAHPILQYYLLEREQRLHDAKIGFIVENSAYVSAPEEHWLYDQNLYKRAEREYTLGYTEIERRIILNKIHEYVAAPSTRESNAALVDEMIGDQRDFIKRVAQRMAKVVEAHGESAPGIFEADLKEARYLLAALYQNKKWLIEFLSR